MARPLELQGHHVESAENGRLAFTKLSADEFDLVLLDIEMPEVDGFEVLAGLAQSGFALGGRRVEVTVLFVDIRGFTTMSEQMRPEDTVDLLDDYYALMFDAITSNGGVVNQMMGDGLAL